MKIALVNTLSYAEPLTDRNSDRFLREFYLPLGLLTAAAIAEGKGHAVRIVDPNMIALNESLSDSVELYRRTAQSIRDLSPDLVGFTTLPQPDGGAA